MSVQVSSGSESQKRASSMVSTFTVNTVGWTSLLSITGKGKLHAASVGTPGYIRVTIDGNLFGSAITGNWLGPTGGATGGSLAEISFNKTLLVEGSISSGSTSSSVAYELE